MPSHLEYNIENFDLCRDHGRFVRALQQWLGQNAEEGVEVIGVDLGSTLHITVQQDENVGKIRDLLSGGIAGHKLTFRDAHKPWPVSGIVIEAGHCTPAEATEMQRRITRQRLEQN